MKKIVLCMLIVMSVVMTACGNQADDHGSETKKTLTDNNDSANTQEDSQNIVSDLPKNDRSDVSESKILIVYFAVAENSDVDAISSASVLTKDGESKGILRVLADDIQSGTGGDVFSIQTSVKYPGDINELIDYAADEQDDDVRPELTSYIDNLEDYDTVFIGYPNWWGDMPMVMYSFFEEHDFAGKTIIPFCVHRGSRFSGTIKSIQELEPDATVITDGFTVSHEEAENAASDVSDWLKELGYYDEE